ncbi:MAG: SDR family oxidoreductase [Candidatus Nanopelagicales bacterium]
MRKRSKGATGRRTVVVTGAASGIGAALAARLFLDGHNVVACDINEAGIEIPEWGINPAGRMIRRHLDVRSRVDWDSAIGQTVGEFGGIDICCNIAGYLKVTTIEEMTDADIDNHIDINVKGVMLGTQAAAVAMMGQGTGHIINMSSLAGLAPPPGLALYSGSKFAVRGFSLATAIELRKRGIALTVVYPDAVQTPMLDVQLDHPGAALTFSGNKALTTDDVVAAIVDHVMVSQPLELGLPRSREALARLAGTAPRLSVVLDPLLTRIGLRNQAKAREAARLRGR